MQSSMFNKQVPLAGRDDVFLMNTFTDAQLVVSRDVVHLLDRVGTTPTTTRTPRRCRWTPRVGSVSGSS